jgi:putative acetyltransferase
MNLRTFKSNDTPELIRLFRDSVHRVCRGDYNPAQLIAWAPDNIDEAAWTQRFGKSFTLIAEEKGKILGFSNLESSGYIDMFYVHADWQGKGAGKLLYDGLEGEARRLNLNRLTSDVSITAQPFFLSRGFQVDSQNVKEIRGVVFKNALMSKSLVSLFDSH